MSFVSRLFSGRKAATVDAGLLESIRTALTGGSQSRAGQAVTVHSALEVSTVLACCRVIAEGVAQVPWHLYRKTAKGRSAASDHSLDDCIAARPNKWQTSFELRETLVLHTLLAGNAFAFVNRIDGGTRVAELIPIEPSRVTVKRAADLTLSYRVTAEGGAQLDFPAEAIWHWRGPSWNSWLGLEATRLARNAIGLAMAIEGSQSDFQANGAQTSGALAVEEKLSPERFTFLSTWIDKHLPGGERASKPLVLDSAAKYYPYTMTGVDQQLVESRRMQVEEICRSFRVMPIMVGHADKAATYASAEQMFLAHVVHTLSPWYQRIEQSANVNLLTPEERASGYYTKFTPNALMRGASQDRSEFYAKALGAGGGKGWLTQNEVRSLEDEDLSSDPEADELPQPIGRPAATNPAPQGGN